MFGNTTCTFDYSQVHSTGVATCVAQGCQVDCAFVEGSGGAASTSLFGGTSCTPTTSPNYTTTVLGNASCYTHGCHSFCQFHGSGGAGNIQLVGNTACDPSSYGGGVASTTVINYVK
jgi:hypothetical protein